MTKKIQGITNTLGSSREKIVNCPPNNRNGSSKKVMQPTAWLKCLYTDACRKGNKQERLEIIVLLENYDVISFKEIYWVESYNWNFMTKGYKIFREGEVRMLPTMLRN